MSFITISLKSPLQNKKAGRFLVLLSRSRQEPALWHNKNVRHSFACQNTFLCQSANTFYLAGLLSICKNIFLIFMQHKNGCFFLCIDNLSRQSDYCKQKNSRFNANIRKTFPLQRFISAVGACTLLYWGINCFQFTKLAVLTDYEHIER